MSDAVPSDSISGVLVGALVAAAGYLAKLGVQMYLGWRKRRAQARAQLLRLDALLRASGGAFDLQIAHSKRLIEMLHQNHPEIAYPSDGYDAHFARTFQLMNENEKELHAIIRGITQHALHPINRDLLAWLRADLTYRTAGDGEGSLSELAAKLNALESHLLAWIAKYEAWIPNDERHALVFLADEKRHGLGFPAGLDRLVAQLVAEKKLKVDGARDMPVSAPEAALPHAENRERSTTPV